jgi:RNA polymerase sigma factor (sigma-70 family)
MAGGPSREFLRDLDLVYEAGPLAGLSDAQLVERFVSGRGEASEVAFRALLARHGAMVWGVCRQVLREPNDVEDAFQATFLVLVRKAGSVRIDHSLGPWLYGVAFRVATRARSDASERRKREGARTEALAVPTGDPSEARELGSLLHEEINRLPDRYRLPVVLCHLEGQSQDEAARQLRCPVGTVSGRLTRARQMLRSRLTRRGLATPAVSLDLTARFEPRPSVPRPLIDSIARAASQPGPSGFPVAARALARGVTRSMLASQLKPVLTLGLIALVTGGVAVAYSQAPGDKAPATPSTNEPTPDVQPPPAPPAAEPSPEALETRIDPAPSATEQAQAGNDEPRTKRSVRRGDIAFDLQPQAVGTGKVIYVIAPKQNRISALKLGKGEWRTYSVPAGSIDLALGVDENVALQLEGRAIQEVAVFNGILDHWSVHKLRAPADGPIAPTLHGGLAAYAIDDTVYAYHSKKDTWVDLRLPKSDADDPVGVRVLDEAIVVQQGETVYVYSALIGQWSSGVDAQPMPGIDAIRRR